jgi:hypothetical protein
MPMLQASSSLTLELAQAPALLELVARTCRREADARRGLELHCATPGGVHHVVVPADRLAELASILDDATGDLRGTLGLLEVDADDEADAGVLHALRGAFAGDDAAAHPTLGVLCDAGVSLILGPARSPTPAEERAVAQARAVHGLIQNDPAMPASLRSRLVTYAGLLLDREERGVALTPAGLAALRAADAASATA